MSKEQDRALTPEEKERILHAVGTAHITLHRVVKECYMTQGQFDERGNSIALNSEQLATLTSEAKRCAMAATECFQDAFERVPQTTKALHAQLTIAAANFSQKLLATHNGPNKMHIACGVIFRLSDIYGEMELQITRAAHDIHSRTPVVGRAS